MPTETDFAMRLRDRLNVDESYDGDIESSVRRYVKKLLRDYNFPKSIEVEEYTSLTAGQQSYELPAGLKKLFQVYFRDTSDPAQPAVGDPLLRREAFVRPGVDGIPRYYWVAGNELWTDITIPASDAANTELVAVYQSADVSNNISWMLTDFEDILFTLSMFRLASELNKTELAAVWASLWQEDMRSLAIYTNELEFDDLDIQMKVTAPRKAVRYPIGENGY